MEFIYLVKFWWMISDRLAMIEMKRKKQQQKQ